MFVGVQRKKEKKYPTNGNKDLKKNEKKICPDYKSRLEEYREDLWNLARADVDCELEDVGEGPAPDYNRNMPLSENIAGARGSPTPNNNSSNGGCDPALVRLSMHWEEFFGSSLDLAPSLLSIYDSIALASKKSEDESGRSQSTSTELSSLTRNNSTGQNKSNQNISSETPSIQIESNQPKCDVNHSKIEEVGRDDGVNDSKKRPLSISSMSSSSSSSLPRHIRKRPNLSEYDPAGRGDMEKLDNLLFIDDDAPSGTTDEEMSVDTDGESSKKCDNTADKDGASLQSSASLSSENDNQEKSNISSSDQIVLGTSENDLLSQSNRVVDDHCNDSQNVSFSSPSHKSFSSSNDVSFVSPATPVSVGPGVSQGITPRSRHGSSIHRDSTSPSKYVTYVQRVVAEIVDTERIYVRYLQEIIDGYLEFLRKSPKLKVSEKERRCLFGNILEIYEFSRSFLEELEQCDDDPLKVADCFVRNNTGFSIYAQYCTNYPSAVEVLTRVMIDPVLCEVFKTQQQALGHNLPLGSYLLKPVQRVLKYHLLLHNILKNYDKKDPGHEILSRALDHMTGMAQHINEMKRKHEHAVRVQEIQSQLEEYEGEDLTRMGELVLEGSFRIYGAKTSRHVFLFEKGILIAKKKEDSMLSSKGVILCSNLMLVESLHKEPLSFQIIPFDNPRGQHTLQARNLDQKRKWCQEIKRLIIESYKGKIPEKVKGLVMQLGKSKEEDSAKPADLGMKKIHHHTAPEYLEKRQRMRRKSGGTLITEILKPQRKRAQRRAESVSPRTSPTLQRKYRPLDAAERTHYKNFDEAGYSSSGEINSPISRDTTASNIPTLTSDGNLPNGERSTGNTLGRSRSFRSAVKGGQLLSADMEDDVVSEPAEVDKVARRSRSFRIATRMKPLRSVDFSDERMSLSNPNTPVLNKQMDFGSTRSTEHSAEDLLYKENSKPQIRVDAPNRFNGALSRSDNYSSMPVLSDQGAESEILLSGQHTSKSRQSSTSSSSSQKLGCDNFTALLPQPKRVIDIKQYFTPSQERKLSTTEESRSNNNNLRKDGKSVSAFHDTFLKKSMESLTSKSTSAGPKSISLTRPLPLTLALKADQKLNSSSCSNVSDMKNGSPMGMSEDDNPWVPNSTQDINQMNSKPLRRRAHSTDGELDSLDWMVYANRNCLPVTGFSTDDIPKLYNNSSSREEIDKCSNEDVFNTCSNNDRDQQYSSSYHCEYLSKSMTPRRSAMSPQIMERYNDTRYSLPTSVSPCDSEGEEVSALGMLPIIQKRRPLTRSNSTPCARVGPANDHLRGARSSSFDMDKVIIDHEKIVAEMEEYLKKSDSALSLEAQRFPTTIIQVTSDDETLTHQQNRDSCASYLSSSSYESEGSYENPHNESIVDTLKHKINDFTNKITHRRSGSYDNRQHGASDHENDTELEKQGHHGDSTNRYSLLSLNSWFTSKTKSEEPDIQSVLQAGELGGPVIGLRMAHPEPAFAEPGLSLTKNKDKLQVACSFDVDEVSSSLPCTESEQSKDNSALLNIQNLNIQQCDSAFSIGDGCNSDESPRNMDDKAKNKKERRRSNSDSSGDSFYERRLSMAFEDGDAFRDSAVYCEMDIDQVEHPNNTSPTPLFSPFHVSPLSPVSHISPLTAVSHISSESPVSPMLPLSPVDKKNVPIKAYVQKFEEKCQSKENVATQSIKPEISKDTAVKGPREPGAVVKQRMESLQYNANRRSSSRSCSEEREVMLRSRPVSEERELSPFINRYRLKRASTPCRGEDKSFMRENSDPAQVFRSRSNTPGSGVLKPSRSLGRLDQLSSDVENLVIMKGWVRQLIQKFQPTNS